MIWAKLDLARIERHIGRMGFQVAAFYKFSKLPQFRALQEPLLAALKSLQIKGSVLLAEEGVNGTLAATPDHLAGALRELERITGIAEIECKFSVATEMPFKRMKVRLKKEIVTIGDVSADPTEKVGTYVEPQDWNALINDPDVIVIDARNTYEYRIGSFKRAIDPKTGSFSEFPAFVREKIRDKNAKVAMFCTGGIRCEKASSFMLHEGFESVYHLKGGILKYLEVVPQSESLWRGECFVFDERVAVGHGLAQGTHTICHGCLMPVSAEDRLSPKYEEGVSCPACADRLSDAQKASNRERQRQVELAIKARRKHLGPE